MVRLRLPRTLDSARAPLGALTFFFLTKGILLEISSFMLIDFRFRFRIIISIHHPASSTLSTRLAA